MDVSNSRGGGARKVAFGASILLNIVLLAVVAWPDGTPEDAPAVAEATATSGTTGQPIAEPAPEAAAEVAKKPTAEPKSANEKVAAPKAQGEGGIQVTVASLKGSIPQTMAVAAEPYGDFVSATLSRILVWDLDVRKDLRPGDKIEAAWTLGTSDTVVIEAARYHSKKFNKTINGYRFKATGDEYASYWSADGVEVPHRLQNSPLAEYEQITSLLKDRPTHHGMDFKVDVGTPVLSAFDGVVTRVNWNWSANGNCVEVRHNDGVLAKYLHLSENSVKEGARVSAGQTVGLSGNTGRSTGPHLHYQLNKGSKVIDPIDYHKTDRRKLKDSDRAAFDAVVAEMNARLDAAGAVATN